MNTNIYSCLKYACFAVILSYIPNATASGIEAYLGLVEQDFNRATTTQEKFIIATRPVNNTYIEYKLKNIEDLDFSKLLSDHDN